MEVELRKAVQSRWVNIVGVGLSAVGIVVCFCLPRMRDWTVIAPCAIAALMFAWRAAAIGRFAQGLKQEIARLSSAALPRAGTWPPPPRYPAA